MVRGRRRGPGAPSGHESPRSSRSASTATARRSSPVDGRGEATRPAITWLDTRADRRGRRAGRGDRRPRLGARRAAGRALGGAPRSGRRRGDPLVPRDLGVARVPADRRGRARRSPRPARAGPGASCARPGVPADRLPPIGRTGERGRRPDAAAADALGLRAGHPGRGRHGRRVRELPRRRAAASRRRLRPGRIGGRVRRLLGSPGRGRRAAS